MTLQADAHIVRARSIHKKFGAKTVFSGVSVAVGPGTIAGLVGPNGVGKTTLLRILSGLIEADAGTIVLNGVDLATNPDRARKQIGFVPDEPSLMEYLTAHELLMLAGSFHGLPKQQLRSHIRELLTLWDLARYEHELIRTFSHGMKQKLWITVALIPSPPILLLDEPLSGLDVYSCAVFKELLKLQASSGKAIIVSSHVLSLIEEICLRVIILARGSVAFDGAVADVLSVSKMEDAVLQLSLDSPDAGRVASELHQVFASIRANN